MVLGGSDDGGATPAPSKAIVGNSLIALRADLIEFEGMEIMVQDGTGVRRDPRQ